MAEDLDPQPWQSLPCGMRYGAQGGPPPSGIILQLPYIPKNCMHRARADWREQAMVKLKLEMTGRLMESECKARCVWLDCKRHRRMTTSL